MLERLQKVLAAAGVASRRDAEALIQAGRVQVDGQSVTTPGTKVDPEHATILVDGRPITARPPLLYLALHKPPGFDTTRADPHARHTVMELVLPGLESKYGRGHPSVEGLHPVGRLDRDSEGLLLLTNDGAFTHALTHPRYGVTKTYVAEVAGRPTPAELEQLRSGVMVEGRLTAPAEARWLPAPTGRRGGQVELQLKEGRKRQVRLMLDAVGHPVRRLVRTAVGPLTLGSLKPGQYRFLTEDEVQSLLNAARPEPEASPPVAPKSRPESTRARPRPEQAGPASSPRPETTSAGRTRPAKQVPPAPAKAPRPPRKPATASPAAGRPARPRATRKETAHGRRE
jgi:23S rRNA pseudouridine2605 synthase